MEVYREQVFDEERALYGQEGVKLLACRFDGPADGESALKEGRDNQVIALKESNFFIRQAAI